MKKLNVAIIGQGRSGRDIHGAFLRSANNELFNVVAIVDELEERRQRAVNEYGCAVYDDYHKLFDIEGIDLVINSTFSYMHAPVAIDLLNHGFNVVTEKPFARSYEEGSRMIEAARKNGKLLNVFQQSRFAPYYKKIKEIIGSGVLGELIQVNIAFNGFARRWDWQTAQGYAGGNLRNTGPHPMDQAMDLLGFPENVTVFSKMGRVNTSGDADDYVKAILTVPGKPLIDVEISSCDAYSPYTYKIMGSDGCLRATLSHIEWKYIDRAALPERPQILTPLCKDDGTPAYCSEKLNWTEESVDVEKGAFETAVKEYYTMIYLALTEGRPMEITPEQVLTQMKVFDQIRAQNPLSIL